MGTPWFTAYFSEDVESTFQAADWKSALALALAKVGEVRGHLEALELGAVGSPRDLDSSIDRHPS
jgi:hypothetical protein